MVLNLTVDILLYGSSTPKSGKAIIWDDGTSLAEAAMFRNVRAGFGEFWFTFREKPWAVIGLYIFAVFAFLALFGPWVAPS